MRLESQAKNKNGIIELDVVLGAHVMIAETDAGH